MIGTFDADRLAGNSAVSRLPCSPIDFRFDASVFAEGSAPASTISAASENAGVFDLSVICAPAAEKFQCTESSEGAFM